jgi:glutaredoxin
MTGAAGAVPQADAARVVLYSRAECHLCAQARAVVAATCADLDVDWVEVDVDSAEHPELRELFSEEVPVTFVDGRQHDFWRVDAVRLRRALTAAG